MSETALYVRSLFEKGDIERDRGLQTPENIERHDDIIYGQDDPGFQSLDVYRPKGIPGKLPVIVNVHGGGFVYGDKERYQYYCMEMAGYGYAVINFSYRLAPEYQFPAPLEDINLVMNWMLAHQEEFGLDVDRLFAVGDSAGATLLASYTAGVTNPGFASHFPFSFPEITFRAIGLFCGSFRFTFEQASGQLPLKELAEAFVPENRRMEALVILDSTKNITSHYPPVYFMTSNADFLKNEAPTLMETLFEQNVPFEFQYFGGTEPLGHVFHLNIRSQQAKKANASLNFYFRQWMPTEAFNG